LAAPCGAAFLFEPFSTKPCLCATSSRCAAGTPAARFCGSRSCARLNLPLIDPDDGYRAIGEDEHTKNGNGLIGGDRNRPNVVVAANGGSDLIYIPEGDKAMAKRIIDVLLTQDYVSGIFVDSKLGKLPGTLSLDDIALDGSAITPHPAIAIFRPRRYLEFHGHPGTRL
jgi:hypothetical protein